jgi:molybdate transport system substrate-binding protein
MIRRIVGLTSLTLLVSGPLVAAADVATLATLAVQGAIVELARDYGRVSGHEVRLTFDTGPNLATRVAGGETADVLIAPAAVVDQAVRDGRVVADSRASIGRVPVGVAVRAGARVPDVSSVDALKRALVEADAVVYSRGTSGVYMEKLFADLGIAEAIRPKAVRLANGGEAMERIVSGRGNDIGFTMVSEIKLFEPRGASLVGPLPPAIQNYTTYVAAVMARSVNQEAASGFVRYITTPAARRAFAATGWE